MKIKILENALFMGRVGIISFLLAGVIILYQNITSDSNLRCPIYKETNLTLTPEENPIYYSDVEEGERFCSKVKNKPCLKEIIKLERGDVVFVCGETQ